MALPRSLRASPTQNPSDEPGSCNNTEPLAPGVVPNYDSSRVPTRPSDQAAGRPDRAVLHHGQSYLQLGTKIAHVRRLRTNPETSRKNE